jgi:hypothetical protein
VINIIGVTIGKFDDGLLVLRDFLSGVIHKVLERELGLFFVDV